MIALATYLTKRLPERACDPALKWVRARKGRRTYQRAWETCPDGAWLIWIAVMVGVDRETIVRAVNQVVPDWDWPLSLGRLGLLAAVSASNAIYINGVLVIGGQATADLVRARIPWAVVREAIRVREVGL